MEITFEFVFNTDVRKALDKTRLDNNLYLYF